MKKIFLFFGIISFLWATPSPEKLAEFQTTCQTRFTQSEVTELMSAVNSVNVTDADLRYWQASVRRGKTLVEIYSRISAAKGNVPYVLEAAKKNPQTMAIVKKNYRLSDVSDLLALYGVKSEELFPEKKDVLRDDEKFDFPSSEVNSNFYRLSPTQVKSLEWLAERSDFGDLPAPILEVLAHYGIDTGIKGHAVNVGTIIRRVRQYNPWIDQYAEENELSANLVRAIICAESSGDPNARSEDSARGLMQVLPSTASDRGIAGDLYDPEINIKAGCRQLRWLFNYYANNPRDALVGYNAGCSWVSKGNQIPEETKDYLKKVVAFEAILLISDDIVKKST